MEHSSNNTTETIPDPKSLESRLAEFDSILEKVVAATFDRSKGDEHCLEELSRNAESLVRKIIPIGKFCQEESPTSNENTILQYKLTYDWMERVKSFLVLWRNILFEQQKAYLLLEEGEIQSKTYNGLVERSKAILLDAAGSVKSESVLGSKGNWDASMKKWKHQNTPWPVHQKQFEIIPEQCRDLLEQIQNTLKASNGFKKIKQHFSQLTKDALFQKEQLKKDISIVLQGVRANDEQFLGKKAVEAVDSMKLPDLPFGNPDQFSEQIETIFEDLPIKKEYAIGKEDGLLIQREIDIQRDTAHWLESEIMPNIYNLYHSFSGIQNKLDLTLLNIRNRYEFDKKEGLELDSREVITALESLDKHLGKTHENLEEIQEYTSKHLVKELKASNIYEASFLNVSMSSTINQYRRYQLQGWRRVRDWFQEKGVKVKQLQKKAQKEDSLSISEKIVRTVRHRTPAPNINHYTNMFLTKGYIGDSFCVGRKDELERIEQIYENWKMGFRGTLLITGTRFSGKSLLGDQIQNWHFPHNFLKITPEQNILFAGRRFEVGYQLKEVLDFIIKHGLHTPSLIWIDDLEKWENEKITLSENVKHLLHTMDHYSHKQFFMVSMSNALKAQLNRFHDIDKVFQSEINTDKMSYNDVREAILIRHNATHNKLMDKDNEELDVIQFDKIIKRLYQASNGNIGEILRRWSYTMRYAGEDEITPRAEYDYSLPEFMSPEAGLLLRSILLHRKTNEYTLRKKFGPAFKTTYKPILNRLFNLGLLKRHLDGTLEINPFLSHDIGKLLDKEFQISYRKKTLNKEKI